MYPLILYFTLSIIYLLSTVCACVLTAAGFVIFCIAFSSIVIVVSFVIVAAAAFGTSIVFVICTIFVACMLIVSCIYIVCAMLYAVVCSFISEEKRNKNGIFAVTTYYKNCKYAIDYFLTACKKYTVSKCYDFPECLNFLSALEPLILWVVFSVTVVVGVATLIAAGATIVAVVVAVAALVVCVVVLCFLIYLIGRCIAACCCKE